MELIIILIFVLGYLTITMESIIKIDKLIPALLMMTLSWGFIALGLEHITHWFQIDLISGKPDLMDISHIKYDERLRLMQNSLLYHFGKTSEILVFLMGAMTIVEIIDHFGGFDVFKNLIRTRKRILVLWIISFISFFLSAIIDNLTATIVLIAILRKITPNQQDRIWISSFIVIAANAGGAWSPIGDVTTTMLWMANKVSTGKLFGELFLPSLANLLIPLIISIFIPAFKGKMDNFKTPKKSSNNGVVFLIVGLLLIVFVPFFKIITHLPPYVGMMLSLGLFTLFAEIMSKRTISFTQIESANHIYDNKGPTLRALSKIEMPSILFFLGILMTVAALETIGTIEQFGQSVRSVMSETLFVSLLGIVSAIVDNVPLVAACISMFPNAPDAEVWHFIAYAAGTGGSLLIIGSASGVVAMGMEKISFGWYLRNITPIALVSYFGGLLLLQLF